MYMNLTGLENARKSVRAVVVSTPVQAMVALKVDGAATMSGDGGAINVWKDKDGKYRAERYYLTRTVDVLVPSGNLKDVRRWLTANGKLIR